MELGGAGDDIHMNDKNYIKMFCLSVLVILLGFFVNSVFFLQKINSAAEDSLLNSNRYLVSRISV